MHFSSASLLLLAPVLVSAIPASTYPFVREQSSTTFAPYHAASTASKAIQNKFLVVFKPGTSVDAMLAHHSFVNAASARSTASFASEIGVKHIYEHTIKGYSATLDENTINLIRASPEVEYIEEDSVVHTMDVQNGAPWGLARISHRPKLTFGTFRKYEYDPNGGEGVDVYVIDTGINVKHAAFEGRASWGHTVPDNDVDEDGNGHGTHCAGTIASANYGVAKKAKVVAVKVLGSNGSGSMSDVVAGVDWAANSAAAKAKAERAAEIKTGVRSTHKGSVANMSLGGGKSKTLDLAVNAAVDSGLHFAVAAGNDNKDACNYSPAAADKAVTVGASTLGDERAYFSNTGKCVDVFAPGLNILSTWIGSEHATNTISGTSMASPHVAGLLAYMVSLYPSKSFNLDELVAQEALSDVKQTLLSSASYISPSANPTFNALLSFASYFLPESWLSSLAPIGEIIVDEAAVLAPIPVPSPKTVKAALILLSSPDKLNNVGEGSPNLLVFNNFTAPAVAEAFARVA